MIKQYQLLLALAFLAGINVFLYYSLHQRSQELNLAHKTLTDSDAVAYHVKANKNQLGYLKSEPEILEADELLAEKLNQLEALLGESNTQEPEHYFGSALNASDLFPDLQGAYRALAKACRHYLEVKIPEIKNRLKENKVNAIREFKIIESKALESAKGTARSSYLVLQPFGIQMEWEMGTDSVNWGYGKTVYQEYLSLLDDKINSQHATEALRLLVKMDTVFSKPDRITVKHKEYDLAHISPAELESVCKYVTLLLADMETGLVQTRKNSAFN